MIGHIIIVIIVTLLGTADAWVPQFKQPWKKANLLVREVVASPAKDVESITNT